MTTLHPSRQREHQQSNKKLVSMAVQFVNGYRLYAQTFSLILSRFFVPRGSEKSHCVYYVALHTQERSCVKSWIEGFVGFLRSVYLIKGKTRSCNN